MASKNDSKFQNYFLDIQYDLSQNQIMDENNPPEYPFYRRTINLWTQYLSKKLDIFPNIGTTVPIAYSEYKFADWIQEGSLKIVENLGEINEVPGKENMKLLIPKVGIEILKFSRIFDKLKCSVSKDALRLHFCHLYLTQQGTIDYIKVANSLLEKANLGSKDKYEISCYFCFKEIIKKLFQKNFGIGFEKYQPYRLRAFWTFHINKADVEFNKYINASSNVHEENNEHILLWAIQEENEIAVQYIWEHFCDHKLKENIVRFVKYSLLYDSTNISCYLISQIVREEQLIDLCLQNGHTILLKLQLDSRWINYFKNAANYAYNCINQMTFSNAIKTVIVLWSEKGSDQNQYRSFLNNFCTESDIDINVDYIFNSETILNVLLYMNDEFIMKILLGVKSHDDLKTIFDTKNIIFTIGKELMQNKKIKIYESFIRKVLTDEEIIEFKRRFMNETGFIIFE